MCVAKRGASLRPRGEEFPVLKWGGLFHSRCGSISYYPGGGGVQSVSAANGESLLPRSEKVESGPWNLGAAVFAEVQGQGEANTQGAGW